MTPLLPTALIVLSSVRPPTPAALHEAPPPDASPSGEESVQDLDREAREAYAERDYSKAAEAFSRAYDKTKDPNYLFNAGRVYEESGELELSVEYYERFLNAGEIDFEARKAALERVEVLKGVLRLRAEKNAPEPESEPEPTTPSRPLEEATEEPSPPPESPEARERRRKLLISGAVVAGVGAAALVAGGVLGGLALRQSTTLRDEEIALEDRRRRIEATETFSLTADVLYAAGGAITVTGVALIIASVAKKRPDSGRSARLHIAPAFDLTSASVRVSSRF